MNTKSITFTRVYATRKNSAFVFIRWIKIRSYTEKKSNILYISSKYLHLPLTSLRLTCLDQLASYIDEGQLITRRCC